MLLVTAVVGCGGANASTTSSRTVDVPDRSVEAMRRAGIELFFADANVTALPRAYDIKVLRRRMRPYMASRWLEGRVEESARAIAKVGGRAYWQPWLESLTVGRWKRAKLRGRSATVAFLAYETICPTIPPKALPMERFTIQMLYENKAWRFVSYEKRWLTGAGPLGVNGALTIRALPQRVVFRNPRPRAWRYRGPRFRDLARCD